MAAMSAPQSRSSRHRGYTVQMLTPSYALVRFLDARQSSHEAVESRRQIYEDTMQKVAKVEFEATQYEFTQPGTIQGRHSCRILNDYRNIVCIGLALPGSIKALAIDRIAFPLDPRRLLWQLRLFVRCILANDLSQPVNSDMVLPGGALKSQIEALGQWAQIIYTFWGEKCPTVGELEAAMWGVVMKEKNARETDAKAVSSP